MGNYSAKSADPVAPVAPVASASIPKKSIELKECPKCRYDVPTHHFRRIRGIAPTKNCINCNHFKLRSAYTRRKLNTLYHSIRQNHLSADVVFKSLRRLQRYSYEAHDRIQYTIGRLNSTDLSNKELYKWVINSSMDFHSINPDSPQWNKLQQFIKIIEA